MRLTSYSVIRLEFTIPVHLRSVITYLVLLSHTRTEEAQAFIRVLEWRGPDPYNCAAGRKSVAGYEITSVS